MIYKIPKDGVKTEFEDKNDNYDDYGFIAFEFFKSTNSAPRDRSLVEVFISLKIDPQNEFLGIYIE